MKRSEYIALGAVGLLAVATFWPSSEQKSPQEDAAIGKGDGFQTLAFVNLDECKAAQIVTASACDVEFDRAAQSSVADAPKFDNQASCEGEYGASACRPASWNGASVFVPALAGILIARSLTNAWAQSQPLYPPRTGPASCPPGTTDRPECAQRSSGSSSGSSSSSGGSSGRRYYSTGTGRVVGRVAASFVADTFLPSRTSVNRSVITRTASMTHSPGSSSSPTTSRGGFGSTSRSYSSSGS